ncbi:YpiF family protein [Salibacterium aidingense]|uniref:YpiF family protein n=1 Tax=Salibacterium aidingense TaxID=384933 RepID=UPI000417B65E|nr:YpiF family protein [Salibacterium aidingense]
MKWSTDDIPLFVKEREYVDTAVLPLLPIDFGDGIRQSGAMTEFITVMSAEIEKQFRGRMLLVPSFTYLAQRDIKECRREVEEWIQEMKKEKMKHIILITADSSWKKVESELDGLLVWMPLVPLENMDTAYKKQVISEQIKQLLPLVMDKWKE